MFHSYECIEEYDFFYELDFNDAKYIDYSKQIVRNKNKTGLKIYLKIIKQTFLYLCNMYSFSGYLPKRIRRKKKSKQTKT